MNLETQFNLRRDPNNIKFLRENSYFYKYLNRDIKYLSLLESQMRESYKLTTKDKLERFTTNIDKVSQIIDIFS